MRVFKWERSWAETQETSLRSDEQCENWVNRINHRKDETSLRCELRFKQKVMRWKREVNKKLRRKRQRRWREMLKVERKRAIIYELRKRRWAVSTCFSQFERASNLNVQTSADKLQQNLNQRLKSEIELKIRSELTLKLYDFVKTSFKLHYIFNLICHELCHVQLDNAWQTLYS